MRRPVLLGCLLVSLVSLGSCTGLDGPSSPTADEPVTRIAFGSCNRVGRAQPLWAPIRSTRPDLWIWLGDIVYADTRDMSVTDSLYARQREQSGYRKLRKETTILGTWDDHDYGANDAGRTYPKRDSSQQLLLDFLDVPGDSPRRARNGVYSAHTFGPPGRQVKVLLLDTRYHRDPLQRDTTSEQVYRPNETGDILGEVQWAWLEKELRESEAQIHLIGTSIQAVPTQHRWEKWANFPEARARLLDVIRRTGAPGVFLLSGDRHMAELSRLDGSVGYPLYELTSSGLTHVAPPHEEPNRHRLGPMVTVLNFGLVTIDWNASPVKIHLEVRDESNSARIERALSLAELQPEE